MTEAQERSANALLRVQAMERFGAKLDDLSDADRKALTREVTNLLRRRSRSVAARQRITVDGVRKVVQRMRNTVDTRRTFPVDLTPVAYALIAEQHAEKRGTMKAIASAAILAVYGGTAG